MALKEVNEIVTPSLWSEVTVTPLVLASGEAAKRMSGSIAS
jgi:hypothetical protein